MTMTAANKRAQVLPHILTRREVELLYKIRAILSTGKDVLIRQNPDGSIEAYSLTMEEC